MSATLLDAPAPPFTLMNANGEPVTLDSLRGQWTVLYFYPKDDTPGCTCEAEEFTKLLEDFQDLQARVIGISGDSPESHRKFMRQYGLQVELLSDPHHEVMRQYGAWKQEQPAGERPGGKAVRSTMIIDPQGVVRYHWPHVQPEGHAEEVRRKLQELQAKSPPSGG